MDDIYDINGYTDPELYAILDLSNPTDRELEAKILHMIWKYENFDNASGDRLVRFFNDIYTHFFDSGEQDNIIEGMETSTAAAGFADVASFADRTPPDQNIGRDIIHESTTSGGRAGGEASARLNPVFRQTTNRIVSIDSQYRNKSAITTDYTFNLSTPLKDVVGLKLNSVQIPYTWYTINANYGSNFVYLKGVSPGLSGGDYDIKVAINAGNYTANALVTAVDDSFKALQTNPEYTDISFGTSGITYDYPSSKSTINIDIKKVYNETDYTLDFGSWSTPNSININSGGNVFARGVSIPSFLGYNWNSYTPNIIRSRFDILPLIANSSSDNAISQFRLDTNNNYFNIINYTGTEYTTDPSNCIVLDNIKITLSLATGQTYSRAQIVSDVSTQLAANSYLVYPYITRIDYDASNNDASNNDGFIGYGKSFHEINLQLNRFNTKRAQNAKVAVIFSNSNVNSSIWYGANSALVFEKSSYEMSNLISETNAPQSSIEIISTPYIYLKCKLPFFNGRTDTGNILGNTMMNDFKIPISNSPAGGYTFTSYLKEINDKIFDASNNGNINTTNTLISVENSLTNIKFDINKRFRENAYILDTSSNLASFINTLKFSGNPGIQLATNIQGPYFTSVIYNIPTNGVVMIIKPKTTIPPDVPTTNQETRSYTIRNTGQPLFTSSVSEASSRLSGIFASFIDDEGDNIFSGTTITFTQDANGTYATLRVIMNKYLIEQYYDIQFVDPSANVISSRVVGCGIGPDLLDASGNVINDSGPGLLTYSNDNGSTWIPSATPSIFSTSANTAAYNGSIWIAAGKGNGNTLAKSTDGINWTGLGKSVFSTQATGVAWNGNTWIATGQGGNTLAKSTDNGNTWTGLGSSTFSTQATSVAWNGYIFAATGQGTNTLATSQNGTNWSGVATNFTKGTGIAWNGYIWVATGQGGNNIVFSKNIMGNTWISSATPPLFSTGANGVVWNDAKALWVAVGSGTVNTIATSYDGNVWTGLASSPFNGNAYGISLSGSQQFVAVGTDLIGNLIATSVNGTSWTVRGASTFKTAIGVGWDNKIIGQNQTSIADVSNSWVQNLKLSKSQYALSDYRTNFSWSQITGVDRLTTDVIEIVSTTPGMNTIRITPVTTGLYTNPDTNNNYTNGLVLTIPNGTYSRDQLITKINELFENTLTTTGSQNIMSGSLMSVQISANGDEYIQLRLNINKVYTTSDYKLVFYDPYSFSTIIAGGTSGRNIGNTSWDATLGWILGFHIETEYILSDITTIPNSKRSGNIVSITGDNVVSISIYNYFMILIDDYNNNHMNDGIVTTTKKETDVKLPGYTNLSNFTADPISGNLIATNISAQGNPLTQKQVYAIQATLDQKTIQTNTIKYNEGPFATNVFGLIPLNIANLPNNSIYVESSIALRDQQRNYFGPVNIQRMSVKLINDRGETVDLNGANWSFSFICEQLYQNNRA
jgi:hypothetical protein